MTVTAEALADMKRTARDTLRDIDRCVLAIRGNDMGLALLAAAAEILGNENTAVIIADTGDLAEEETELVLRACDTASVFCTVLPVDIEDCDSDNGIKRVIFSEILHEAWMHGYDVVADACDYENYSTNGNIIQHEMGVISPLKNYKK